MCVEIMSFLEVLIFIVLAAWWAHVCGCRKPGRLCSLLWAWLPREQRCVVASGGPGGLLCAVAMVTSQPAKDQSLHPLCVFIRDRAAYDCEARTTSSGLGPGLFSFLQFCFEWNRTDQGPTDQCVLNTKVSMLTLNTPLIGPTSQSVTTWRESMRILFYNQNNNQNGLLTWFTYLPSYAQDFCTFFA